jgi:hypothetical protein
MKIRWILSWILSAGLWSAATLGVVVLGLGLIVLVPVLAVTEWDHFHTLYPTPEKESIFLRTYSAQKVVDRFNSKESNSVGTGHHSGGAGRKCVSFSAGDKHDFAINEADADSLMIAARDDVRRQLRDDGATVLSDRGDLRYGFTIHYRTKHNEGALAILPLRYLPPSHIYYKPSLPEGLAAVELQVEWVEQYFPAAIDPAADCSL